MLKHDGKTAISKFLLFSALIILLMFASSQFNMDCAYAADVNGSSEMGGDLDLEDEPINSQDNEILEVNNQDSQELLKATRTPSGNTYKSIQDAVDVASDGDTILLKGTYFSNGDYIKVKKRLTITSDSTAVLDGKHLSAAFFLYAESAGSVIKNLKFINGRGSVGSAVIVYAKNVKIQNCIFEDNHANTRGAINTRADLDTSSGLVVDNCQFRRNTAYFDDLVNESNGAALSMFGRNSEVKNSIFEDNWVKGKYNSYGGAIQVGLDLPGSNGKVTNCIFINNSAKSNTGKSHGGAGCVRSGTAYRNCLFIGNSAGEGGALTFHGSGEIKNCTFLDNHANFYGGALSTGLLYDYMELTVTDCNFEGNDAPMGGAIQANGKNIIIDNSNFKANNVSKYGGAIYGRAEDVTIKDSIFNSNNACIDGGAVYIEGKNTVVQDSLFVSNEAIPDVNKLDDGLGGAIYVNSSQALIKDNSFRFNSARNGSAIYYDREGDRLTLDNNELFQNQAWVYQLPIHTEDIYYGGTEKIRVVLFGGNNIADFDNLQVSNAIFNAADNVNIVIDGEYPVYGATDSGKLYQDGREYNIDVHLSVQHEDGTVVYEDMGRTSYLGEIILDLDNLKPGKYFVSARHYEDTYYKAIANATTFVVSPKVDIEVRKAISKDVVDYEDLVTWTITLRNNGPNDATEVMLHDVLPEGLIWLSDTSNKKYDSETGILSIGNLNVNETYSFDIVTIVNATGKIINKVNVTSAEFDSNLTNNYAEKSLFVNPAADLSVIKSVSNANPKYKDSINWTIEISNNGPDVAHDVTMFDLLPKSLIYVNSDEDYDVESGLWVVGTLGKGEKAVLNIKCIVNGTGLFENFVSVNATEHDYDTTNNNDTERIQVNPSADLSIVKEVNSSSANFGDIVKWTLTVYNNGPDDATNVRIWDCLPEGFRYINSTLAKGIDDAFRIDSIAVGETLVIEIVTAAESTGEFANYANVSSDEYDYDLANNEDEEPIFVNPAADLSVTKSVSDSNPSFYDIITWTIEIINNGPDVAHNVTVIDLLPKSLIWIDDDSLMDFNPLNGELFIYQLDVGESHVLNMDCRVNGTGFIQNNVSVSASEYDNNLTNNFANESIDVEKSADVYVIKSVNNSSPNYGDLVKWTLVISNNGPDKATNVYVEDFLPDGLKLVSYNATKGIYDEGIWAMCCLNNGDVETLEIICRVVKTGKILNLATIHADEYDCNPSNNEDNESIAVPFAIDLQVMVEANNTSPLFGQAVNWIITVSNNGPDNATGAILEDILPDELVFLEYWSSKGIFENGVWDIGSLDVGETVNLNITTVSNALGVIINGASTDANEYDWNMSNNHDDDSIDVRPVADLSITKLVDNKSPRYGEIVKWTLVALNQGPNIAHNVIVRDVLPRGLTFVSSNGQYHEGIWDVVSLDVGEEKSIEIICKVASTGDFINLATIEGDERDIDESDNQDDESIHVEPASDLSITKIASRYYYHVGDVIEYVIEISNNGPDVAQNVKVTDVLDKLLKLKSFKASKGRFDRSSNAWTIDSLGSGESAKLIIRVIAVGSGMVSNNAIVTSDTFDHDLSNNQDSAIVNVTEKSSNEPCILYKANPVKKIATVLELHPTANPLLALLISSIFAILLPGVRISKK